MTKYWEDRILKAQEAELKDLYRILQALQHRPLLYSEIKRLLNLKPARLERLLRKLRRGMWVIAHTVPTKKCKILVEYRLSKRGVTVLRVFAK